MKLLVPALMLLFAAQPAHAGGAVHGTVTTTEGETFTGTIRWDRNENFWDDMIDATKAEGIEVEDHDGLNLRVFGVQIVRTDNRGRSWVHPQFTIPMGHLAAIEPASRDEVRLELKNGDVLDVRESSDLGSHMRGIVVAAGSAEEVELDWEDIDRVEFTEGPDDLDARRLYGTVETTIGEFTGYIVWDKDEALTEDELDGEWRGRDREVPFGTIRSIEKTRRGARITLESGNEMELTGTNDVDDDNRGIEITIAEMGRVTVGWDEFKRVTFSEPPPSPTYASFDGGRKLRGTVSTRDGEALTGSIVWDLDETYSWECIDGEIRDVEFEIQFEYISRIERVSRSSARVILRDGLEFTLRGSNDVNDENKGILVIPDGGETIEVGWDDLESVSFSS